MELHLDRLVHVNVELAEFVAEFPVPVLGALKDASKLMRPSFLLEQEDADHHQDKHQDEEDHVQSHVVPVLDDGDDGEDEEEEAKGSSEEVEVPPVPGTLQTGSQDVLSLVLQLLT